MIRSSPARRSALPAAVALAALALAGCAGIGAMEEARAMPAEELATRDDEFVCERLRAFGYVADVPVVWLREAQRRDLENCIAQGAARRHSDDRFHDRFTQCDRFAPGRLGRCW